MAYDAADMYAELARVVCELGFHKKLGSLALPYPHDAQLILDRLTLRCLRSGHEPPKGLPDLMAWCTDPDAVPSVLGLPSGHGNGFAQPLIDPQRWMPTRTCLEWASRGPQGTVEQEADDLVAQLAARAGTPGLRRRCLTFVGDHPSVVQRDRMTRGARWDTTVWHQVRHLYRPAPDHLVVDRTLLLCGTCGLPALTTPTSPSGGYRCEREICPTDVEPRVVTDPAQALVLAQSLRAFVVIPRPTEKAVLEQLEQAGIRAVPLSRGPGVHRLTGERLTARTMLVADRRQPVLLAYKAEALLGHLAEERLLVVVPGRAWDTPGYRAEFEAAVSRITAPGRIVLTKPEELVRQARAERTRTGTRAEGSTLTDA
ncbi:hypothetical protein [Streptomyces sp. NPDC090025]|uniref:pPIWI_RE_Y domain-containing protein n=1 Tax=Streptomyces sp. NPDC090025 TaxID=3365922 RepID=UPI0038378AAE